MRIYHFMHYFNTLGPYQCTRLSDEDKIRIAKKKAIEALAEELMKKATFKVNEHGDVEGSVEI